MLAPYGLWRLLRAELCSYRFLAVTFFVLYVLFVATPGRPYYLNGLYGVVAAAGAPGLQRRTLGFALATAAAPERVLSSAYRATRRPHPIWGETWVRVSCHPAPLCWA